MYNGNEFDKDRNKETTASVATIGYRLLRLKPTWPPRGDDIHLTKLQGYIKHYKCRYLVGIISQDACYSALRAFFLISLNVLLTRSLTWAFQNITTMIAELCDYIAS
ncbi:hypothetical protein ACU8KH_04063 [Lachancea thermotolerans]